MKVVYYKTEAGNWLATYNQSTYIYGGRSEGWVLSSGWSCLLNGKSSPFTNIPLLDLTEIRPFSSTE